MKRKNLISLSVSLTFLTLGVTGLLLYFGQKMKPVETIHSLVGVVFVGFAIFHVTNNWSSLTSYMKDSASPRLKKEFVFAAGLVFILIVGTALSLPPFVAMAKAGESLFRKPGPERQPMVSFEEISTNKDLTGTALSVTIQKNPAIKLPVVAVWVEDSIHQFVNNIFVPSKTLTVSNGEENIDRAIFEGEVEMKDFEAALLPIFNAHAKDQKPNYDKATPNNNFIINTNTVAKRNFYVLLELKNGDTIESYEALVDRSRGEVFKLKATEKNESSVSAIVEIK
jgi:hypothetical protein